MKKVLLFLLLFISSCIVVNAQCTTSDANLINNQSNLVNANYDFIDEDPRKFVINVNNLTKNIYVIITNDNNNNTLEYHYTKENNGKVSFDATPYSKIVKYTIKTVSENVECSSSANRTIEVIKPIYNYFYDHSYCNGIESFYLCSKFTTNNITLEELKKQTDKYRDSISSSILEVEQMEKTSNNNMFIAIMAVIIIIIGTLYYLNKKIQLAIEINKRGI